MTTFLLSEEFNTRPDRVCFVIPGRLPIPDRMVYLSGLVDLYVKVSVVELRKDDAIDVLIFNFHEWQLRQNKRAHQDLCELQLPPCEIAHIIWITASSDNEPLAKVRLLVDEWQFDRVCIPLKELVAKPSILWNRTLLCLPDCSCPRCKQNKVPDGLSFWRLEPQWLARLQAKELTQLNICAMTLRPEAPPSYQLLGISHE